jgi:Argonaute linker 1 domain
LGGLEAYIGFEKSVRTSNAGLLLNVNASTSAFYRTIRVGQLITEWAQYGSDSDDVNTQKQYIDANVVLLNRFLGGV